MMTRFRLASMVLVLLLCTGQAFADSTCSFSAVTISSAGTINVTCGGSGLSVTLKNAAATATNCSYKDATPLSGIPAISINSSGVTAYCPGASVVSDTCSGIAVPPYAIDAGTASANMIKTHSLIAAAASERASGAIRFTVPTPLTTPLTFKIYKPGTTIGEPALVSVDMAISTDSPSCPGDFLLPSSKCKVPATNQTGVKISSDDTACKVTAGGIYYLNIRAVTPGRDVVFDLKAE